MFELKVKQMECFLEVAESLNLTSSAKKLFISQPLASKWIQALEEELEMPLFRREKTGLVLTEQGKYLKEKWTPILRDLSDSVEAARLLSAQAESTLRIGCLDLYQYEDYLPKMLKRYTEKNPKVSYQVEACGPKELAEHLLAHDIDVMIHSTLDIQNNEDFFYIPLKKMRFGIAMAQDHPLASKEEVHLVDIKNQVIYGLNTIESPTSKGRIMKQCRQFGFEPREIIGVANFSTIAMKLLYEKGVALVPEECMMSYGDQIKFFFPEELVVSEYMAVVLRTNNAGESAKRFAEFASEYARDEGML